MDNMNQDTLPIFIDSSKYIEDKLLLGISTSFLRTSTIDAVFQ